MTPEERFNRWFVIPIQTLQKLENGDGAFVALMAVLPLYERAVTARLKLSGVAATDLAKQNEINRDLCIDSGVRSRFWAIFRNGFTHQAMGLDGRTKWRIDGSYGASPTIMTEKDIDFVCIDPWKFASHVLKMFADNPALITASESFPFADIFDN